MSLSGDLIYFFCSSALHCAGPEPLVLQMESWSRERAEGVRVGRGRRCKFAKLRKSYLTLQRRWRSFAFGVFCCHAETFLQTSVSESLLGGRRQATCHRSRQTCSRCTAEEVINRLLFLFSFLFAGCPRKKHPCSSLWLLQSVCLQGK